MTDNPHFESVSSWQAAGEKLSFEPLVPGPGLGYTLQSLSIHVRDHNRRELPRAERSLEAYFDGFVFTQAKMRDGGEARQQTVEVAYGARAMEAEVGGHPARVYEPGPEPPADDVDGRSPAVVVWHDDDLFYLLASGELTSLDLMEIARAFYG